MSSKLNKLLLDKRKTYVPVSYDKFDNENDFLNQVAGILNSGADIIELRNIDIPAGITVENAKKIRELTGVFNALLIIFDRIDIAKLVNADGIMLDKDSISIKDAQILTEKSMLIGFYAENELQAQEAQNAGADFILSKENLKSIDIRTFIYETNK